MKKNTHIYLVLGVLAATVLGITTDQIWQNVYDSANTAFRSNVVVGGGGSSATPTPQPTATPLNFGTAGVVAVFGSPELQPYPGFTPSTGFVTALSASGAPTLATPVPPTPVPTATPQPTATPISPQYRGAAYTSSGAVVAANSGNNFFGLSASSAPNTTETLVEMPSSIAVTLKNLSCYWVTAPAGSTSWTATVRTGTCGAGLSDSTLTCTLTGNGSAKTCTDNSHSVAVTANQCVSINVVATNTPTTSQVTCDVEADY